MTRRYLTAVLISAAVVLSAAACSSGRHSSAGFRLPDSGDPARGKAAFLELGCHNCHSVSGTEIPPPSEAHNVKVVLGGEKAFEMADGYLVTSIINPNYRLANYPMSQAAPNGASLMPSHADKMTVQQMVDIVAFLQQHYTMRSLPTRYSAY